MTKESAILHGAFLCLILSAGLAVGQQCFVPGQCSGLLAGIADENGADACLTSVRIRSRCIPRILDQTTHWIKGVPLLFQTTNYSGAGFTQTGSNGDCEGTPCALVQGHCRLHVVHGE